MVCALLVLMPVTSFAQQQSLVFGQDIGNFYATAFVDRVSLGVNDSSTELRPAVLSIAPGFWLREGIGIEFEAGFGFVDDSVGALDLDFDSALSVNLRLESPPSERFAVYVMGGYIRTTYTANLGGLRESLSLPGGRIGLGFTYHVSPRWVVDTSFTHHDYDNDTRINSFRLGIRLNAGS